MTASLPGGSGHREPDLAARKLALRDQLQTARRRLTVAEVGAAAGLVAQRALALVDVRRAATLTAYVSVGTEPGTGLLLEALHTAGKRILLPITVRHEGRLELDWAAYAGPESLVPAKFGLLEPAGPALGLDAIAGADVVLAPGIADDAQGFRIGKGAGCYDRALTRMVARTPVIALLYDAEVGRDVPIEAHDQPVTMAVTPARVVRF